MNDSFWEGGHAALAEAIQSEFDDRLRELQAALKECQDAARERELFEEIQSTKAKLRRELRRIRSYLF